MRIADFASLLGLLSCSLALAQAPPPKTLQPADVIPKLQEIKTTTPPAAPGDYIVDGTRLFDGWFLKSERIVFKRGATLVFSKQAQDARRNFFIVTREIVTEDPGAPGTITWQQPPVPGAPASGGQAPTGAHAPGDDRPGSPGQQGAHGPLGYAGNASPSITLTVLIVPSSGPAIDLRGQKAGQGGQGQRGGDGGNGGKGHPATCSMFDCRNGAGDGGSGGTGGPGGRGGDGGKGGAGAAFTLLAPADKLQSFSQRFRVLVSGGDGGEPGTGGPGGNGGRGGDRGAKCLPYCKDDGRDGATGGPGAAGGSGTNGSTGIAGDFFVGSITAEQFKYAFE